MPAFDLSRARAAQEGMARQVSLGDEGTPIESVCGMDVAYIENRGTGAAVILSFPDLELIESAVIEGTAPVPYIPTFLAFREMHFLVRLMSRLGAKPSLFMVNGHGIYHPRSMGLASHFGIAFNVPTIGVARGLLEIEGQEIVNEGAGIYCIYLGGRMVCCSLEGASASAGAQLGGKRGIWVSAGHRLSLERAVDIARSCIRGHRIPEPLFLADKISREVMKGAVCHGQ